MKKKKKPLGLWAEVVREFVTNYDLDFMEESGFVFDGIFYLLYFKYHEDLGINDVLEFNEKFSQELEKIQYS
jgi:hypothetical protein